MILVYLLFCIVIGLINRRTNMTYALILGIFGLNFFLNGNILVSALQSIVYVPKIIVSNTQVMLLVTIIILLFILSNLLNLINVDILIDKKVQTYSKRRQELIAFFLSFFSTNLEMSNSDIGVHHKRVFAINSGITPFVNPISINVIFLSTLLIMFDKVNGLNTFASVFLIVINIPAIWWIFKQLAQIIVNYKLTFTPIVRNMNLIRPSIEVFQTDVVQKSISGSTFLSKLGQFLALAIFFSLFIPSYKIYAIVIIYLLLLILYCIHLGVKAAYVERIMAEEEIYRTIRDSILGIGPELLNFCLVLIFSSLSYDYIARYYANVYNPQILFILMIIGLIVGMSLFKDYLIGITIAMPLSLIWITSNYAINSSAIDTMYVCLISTATLIQILYLINIRKVGTREAIDLSILIAVSLSTILVLLYVGIVPAVTLFTIYAIIYILILMYLTKKDDNDNVRHS